MVKQENKNRIYYGKVAVVGPSGTGKSYLSKTADKKTTGYVNIERKPLPYKIGEHFSMEGKPKNWTGFMKCIKDYGENPELKTIIIDSQTMAFNILQKEMSASFTGFDVYKQYNRNVYDYLELIKNIEKDIIILSHDELIKLDEGSRVRRMAVHGKEFEGKIEQHYTIILYTGTRMKDNKPEYFLKTFEQDTSTKVPEGLFGDKLEIPNDAEFIFKSLENYYSQ
jgi:nicotinamide riboside kinase